MARACRRIGGYTSRFESAHLRSRLRSPDSLELLQIMTNRFRILQVSHAAYSGGAERIAYTLFDIYRQMGHTSSLAVGWKDDKDPDIYQIPPEAKGWEWFWDAVAWRVPAGMPGSKPMKNALDYGAASGKAPGRAAGAGEFPVSGDVEAAGINAGAAGHYSLP